MAIICDYICYYILFNRLIGLVGRVFAKWIGRPGFNPRSSHTKDFKNGTCTARGHASPYLFIICLDYVVRTSIDKINENGFELTKKRSRRYPAKTITDAGYADDIAILANTPVQAETLLHCLERAAAGIGLYVKAHKTELICFNQTGDISTLSGSSLKLGDRFTHLGNSVLSTEKYIDTLLTKAWTAIDRLSVIWSQTWPIKWNAVSSKQRSCRYCYMDELHGR